MKTQIKINQGYIPGTDETFARLSVILLKKKSEELYNPTKQFSIDFKPKYAYESEEIINKLRSLADTIENGSKSET